MDLSALWMRTCRAVGARDDVAGAGARLIASYGDGSRSYHDLAHLAEVLDHLGRLAADRRTRLPDPAAAELAAWYHDAVYDPTAGDNEDRSADLARDELTRLRVPAAVVAEVQRLVRLTRLHDPAPGDFAGAALCDADLAVLARPAAGYAAYVAAVRREYAHVPDALFRTGRGAVLQGLLDLPELFRTPYGREHWQAPAVANLTAELAGPPMGRRGC